VENLNLAKQFEFQISNWGKFQIKLGQKRNFKITFDISQQLEKLPKQKLFILMSPTTFILITFQDSK